MKRAILIVILCLTSSCALEFKGKESGKNYRFGFDGKGNFSWKTTAQKKKDDKKKEKKPKLEKKK